MKFSELYERDLEHLPETLRQEEGIIMAMESLHRAYATDEVRQMIEERLKFQRDRASELADAKDEGLQQGLEQGRRETVQKLLAAGIDADTLFRFTGIRLEDDQTPPDVE